MDARGQVAGADRWLSSAGRGALLCAALGGVLGGVAGTIDWPLAGTFFGAVESALAGAVVGGLDGAALTLLAHRTQSRWAARATSGAIAGGAAVGVALTYVGPIHVAGALAAVLVAAGAVIGGALGPLIMCGVEPVTEDHPARNLQPPAVGRFIVWGAALGAAAGASGGLIVGTRTYLPTSPFAAVEGALLGVVSGVVLACLAAGVTVLVRRATY